MKKNFIKNHILLLFGIFISGGILALVVNPIFSKNYNQITQESEVSTQYGPQGYGRGNGQMGVGDQSGKNKSNKGDSEYNSVSQQGLARPSLHWLLNKFLSDDTSNLAKTPHTTFAHTLSDFRLETYEIEQQLPTNSVMNSKPVLSHRYNQLESKNSPDQLCSDSLENPCQNT